ncbi:MAG: cation diffusion facilitator family transporter [Lachnospiraceae bacterium]|nr:cation diffusion facilitator family transporter [Lachnospiraceae bacterium]
MSEDQRSQIANKVSFTTIIVNVILSVLKLIACILGRSSAMLADGVHTISDVITTIAVIVGMHFSSKPADDEHPYGHEKIECVVAKMLSIALLATALGIGANGIKTIIAGNFLTPTPIALGAALVSIVSKEWMYQYTVRAAKKINSPALKADAWHHRSDALSSIGTLLGIGGAMMGFQILDPIASLVVSVLVIKVSIEIYISCFNQLVDHSAPLETIVKIQETITNVPGVICIDDVKTRMHGSVMYVDAEISVDGNLSVSNGHKIAENVHLQIEKEVLGVKHCMVHINPYQE